MVTFSLHCSVFFRALRNRQYMGNTVRGAQKKQQTNKSPNLAKKLDSENCKKHFISVLPRDCKTSFAHA